MSFALELREDAVIINLPNSNICIEQAIRQRRCTVCKHPILKGKHHLAVQKDYRYNICFDCLLLFAKMIHFYDQESK